MNNAIPLNKSFLFYYLVNFFSLQVLTNRPLRFSFILIILLLGINQIKYCCQAGKRGAVLETLLCKLLLAPVSPRVIAMSATVGNLNELADFLKVSSRFSYMKPIYVRVLGRSVEEEWKQIWCLFNIRINLILRTSVNNSLAEYYQFVIERKSVLGRQVNVTVCRGAKGGRIRGRLSTGGAEGVHQDRRLAVDRQREAPAARGRAATGARRRRHGRLAQNRPRRPRTFGGRSRAPTLLWITCFVSFFLRFGKRC